MTKKDFEWTVALIGIVTLAPLAWMVHANYSWTIQVLFVLIVVAVAYALRKFVYEPLKARFPDD